MSSLTMSVFRDFKSCLNNEYDTTVAFNIQILCRIFEDSLGVLDILSAYIHYIQIRVI